MKKLWLLGFFGGIILFLPSAASAQNCLMEEMVLFTAQIEYEDAKEAYDSWENSYDSKSTIIDNTYYIAIAWCHDNIVCYEEAADDRHRAQAELQWEGDDLRLEMQDKERSRDWAQAGLNSCMERSGH